MRRHSFSEVMDMDRALHQLAFYDVTNGKMVIPKSMDEIASIETEVAKKFNYFKAMIQRGSCTFDAIKCDILDKNGPFPQKRLDPDDDNFIEELTACMEAEKFEREEREQLDEKTRNIVKLLLDRWKPEINESEQKNPPSETEFDELDKFNNFGDFEE